jgi:hypothetical protein
MFEDNDEFVGVLNHLVNTVEHQLDNNDEWSKLIKKRVQHAWKLVEEMELNNLENKKFNLLIEHFRFTVRKNILLFLNIP